MAKRTIRTVLGIIVAPAAAPIIVGIVQASTRPPVEGPSWIAAFAFYFMAAALISYGVSYTFGAVTIVALRRFNRESGVGYSICGFVFGSAYGLIVSGARSLESIALAAIFGLLGLSVALTFSLVAGNIANSNHLPDPTSPSVTPPAGAGGVTFVGADH